VQLAAGRWFIDLTSTWGFVDWRRRQMRRFWGVCHKSNKNRDLDSLWTTTGEKHIKLLHDLLLKCTECSRKTQTQNPGFSCC